MYIDIHTHLALARIYPYEYLSGMFDGSGININEPKFKKIFEAFLNDQLCEKFVKQMDDAEISKSVLLIIDGGIKLTEPNLSIEQIHEIHYEILRKFPDRFFVFAGIDPRRGKKGLDLFKKSIFEYGFSGLKLYPPMGYSVEDILLEGYYEICNDKKLTVLIHTGPSLATLENSFAEPKYVNGIAKKYPNINFVLAHAGNKLDDSQIQQVLELPNVYADISGFQSLTGDNVKRLKLIFDDKFNHKILFGTDWPLFNIFNSLKSNIKKISNLFYEENTISNIVKLENIFYRNASNVLRLK